MTIYARLTDDGAVVCGQPSGSRTCGAELARLVTGEDFWYIERRREFSSHRNRRRLGEIFADNATIDRVEDVTCPRCSRQNVLEARKILDVWLARRRGDVLP